MWRRALAVWLLIIGAETVHGVLRTLLLVPLVGDFRARQVGVLSGSLLILAIAYLCIGRIRARRTTDLVMIGAAWVVLTLAFEIGVGRLAGSSLGTSAGRL